MAGPFDPNELAKLYVASHERHQPVAAGDIGAGPQTLEHAYAVQTAVMAGLGSNGGFKTARPDSTKPNILAPIPAVNIRPSPASYEKDEMRLVGVEIELAFRIDSDLPELDAPNYDARLREAVSAVAAIEMVDSRLADRDGASDLLKLSDNQSGFGLVTGQSVKDFAGLNLTNPAVTLTINGEQIGPTNGQIPGAVDAFQVLKDFLEAVGDHCGGVQPGMYVTTGALSGLHWAAHGCETAGSIEGLGAVSVVVGV